MSLIRRYTRMRSRVLNVERVDRRCVAGTEVNSTMHVNIDTDTWFLKLRIGGEQGDE